MVVGWWLVGDCLVIGGIGEVAVLLCTPNSHHSRLLGLVGRGFAIYFLPRIGLCQMIVSHY